jgi:hypothetical protein
LIISVELVLYELSEISDEIFEWAKEHKLMFRPLNNQVQEIAKDILFKYPNLINLKKKFNADPFVIAFAKVHSCVVVLKKIQAEIPIKLKYPMYVKL